MGNQKKQNARDWFRTEGWTSEDQEEFFGRLKRARKHNRGQYLRIKASAITDKYPDEAIKLLQTVLDEYPQRVFRAMTFMELAECYIHLRNSDRAIEYFRKTLAFEKEFPNAITNARFEFPIYVVKSGLTTYYDEAFDVLCTVADNYEKNVTFPIQGFKLHAATAIICDYLKQIKEATQHAKIALDLAKKKHSGFRYHAKLGLVNKPDRGIMKQLNRISIL